MFSVSNLEHTLKINHLQVTMTANDGSLHFSKPIPNPAMDDPEEMRYCLAGYIPGIQEAASIALHWEDKPDYSDPMGASKLYTLMNDLGYELYGGTSLNHGTFYGVNWSGHPFRNTADTVAYLSLLFTPFSVRNGQPQCFNCNILVVSDAEYEAVGLPAGYGTLISWKDHGQVRFLAGNKSVGKGVAVSRATLSEIGLEIPAEWQDYGLIVCESDIKINPLQKGSYSGFFGITNINLDSIDGQEVGLGFEFWQFIQKDETVLQALREYLINSPLPTYTDMVLSLENQRKFAAYCAGRPYIPLEINASIQEIAVTLGERFPWAARHLEPIIAGYLLGRKVAGTKYHLAIVVKNQAVSAKMHSSYWPHKIVGKYPITAGLYRGTEIVIINRFAILPQSIADSLNIDSDGDAVFLCDPTRNPIFQTILDKELIKPIRPLDVQSKGKYDLPLTLENLARTAWRIYTASTQIGNLTINYYLSEIANETLGANIDLSLFYKGIEKVIKSAKHKMDLQFLSDLDWQTMQSLRELLTMPFLRAEKKSLQKDIRAGKYDYPQKYTDIMIPEPLHYAEHIWNWTLERIANEITKLRENTLPVSDFADRIGLNIIPPELEEQFNREVKQIQALINIWVAVGKGTVDRKAGLRAIHAAASTFSVVALREALRGYLSRTTSDGGFLVHAGYGRLNEIFGQELRYTLPDKGNKLIRLWNDDGLKVDYATASQLLITDGIPHVGETIFVPGDETGVDIDTVELIEAIPYCNKQGEFTQSLWALVN